MDATEKSPKEQLQEQAASWNRLRTRLEEIILNSVPANGHTRDINYGGVLTLVQAMEIASRNEKDAIFAAHHLGR